MTPDRRTLLKGLSALPLAGLAGMAPGLAHAGEGGKVRILVDARLPGAQALAAAAMRRGLEVADPRGEIVAHVLARGPDWLGANASIIGLTSYSDMMLMRDLARGAGRAMRFAAERGSDGRRLVGRIDGSEAALLAAMARSPRQRGQAGAFFWLV